MVLLYLYLGIRKTSKSWVVGVICGAQRVICGFNHGSVLAAPPLGLGGQGERGLWRHYPKAYAVLWAHLNVPEIIFKVKS